MNKLLFIVGILLLSGCARTISFYQDITSGEIGCSPKQIEITNLEEIRFGYPRITWTATCKGKKYYCTRDSSGKSSQTSCAEGK